MNNERLMGIGLTLLTIALWVGPIVLAFNSNGWDVKETILPSGDQLDDIKNRIEGIVSKGENIKVEKVDNTFSSNNVSLTISVESPLTSEDEPFDTITLKKMEATISDNQGDIVTLKLGQEIEIGPEGTPEGTKEITFSGEPTQHGKNLIQGGQFEDFEGVEISEGIFKFEIGGLSLELSLENMMGEGPSGGGPGGFF